MLRRTTPLLSALLITLVVVFVSANTATKDYPVEGQSFTSLDSPGWTVSTPTDTSIKPFAGDVPGDIITDLWTAGLIEDPLYELNWLNSSIWADNTWVYSRTFTLSEETLSAVRSGSSDVLLVFDGIKMGATIAVNGQSVGTALDQFLRYQFPLAASGVPLLSGLNANTITVTFDPSITVSGRFMACTGGWDWAPYTNTNQTAVPINAQTFTFGLWKSVYAVTVDSAAITYLVPHVFYTGSYPNSRLQPHDHADFSVHVRTHFWAPTAVTGTLTLLPAWSATPVSQSLSLPAGDSNITVQLPAKAADIDLWWPIGLGGQPLYNVTASFTPNSVSTSASTSASISTSTSASASREFGFRFFALVTGNDTDPTYVKANAGVDGTDGHGMVFRVNGAAFFTRGANMIPMTNFEGQMDHDALVQLVTSAADGGMNMLRVWGGGIFQDRAFYETADKLGIIIYHDMQFAQQGHSPSVSSIQEAEFRHQIRRLSQHPSIVIFDGCNECKVDMSGSTAIYATFVLKVVAEEDQSRVLWPSCPASGWASGAERLSGLPNGKTLTTRLDFKIETHGPYEHGSGFPTVNGASQFVSFSPMTPPVVSQVSTGLGVPNLFTSETGASVMSSFESMSVLLAKEHWGLHGGAPPDTCTSGFTKTCTGGNTMAQRNYACDSYLKVYFNASDDSIGMVGETPFKHQLYQCMIGQALNMKGNLEQHRATNCFGTLIWQLGEIWPTGGWGSIEMAATKMHSTGQVMGGRWKPLHYWLRSFIFQDVFATCGAESDGSLLCIIKNDRSGLPLTGSVSISALSFASGSSKQLTQTDVNLSEGPGQSMWVKVPGPIDGTQNLLQITVTDSSDSSVALNTWVPLAIPGDFKLPKATVSVSVAPTANPDGTVDVMVSTDNTAVFVTLTTLASGRFSDNAFTLSPAQGKQTLQFLPFGGAVDISLLKSSIRVEHVADSMSL